MYKIFWSSEQGFGAIDWVGGREAFLSKTLEITTNSKNTLTSLADFVANAGGVRLCSERMHDIICRHATPLDALTWTGPVSLIQTGSQFGDFYLLDVPADPALLDEKRTLFHEPGHVVLKPSLLADRLIDRAVVSYSKYSTASMFVDEPTLRELQAARRTGFAFTEVGVG